MRKMKQIARIINTARSTPIRNFWSGFADDIGSTSRSISDSEDGDGDTDGERTLTAVGLALAINATSGQRTTATDATAGLTTKTMRFRVFSIG